MRNASRKEEKEREAFPELRRGTFRENLDRHRLRRRSRSLGIATRGLGDLWSRHTPKQLPSVSLILEQLERKVAPHGKQICERRRGAYGSVAEGGEQFPGREISRLCMRGE